jgi:hypothetical protein
MGIDNIEDSSVYSENNFPGSVLDFLTKKNNNFDQAETDIRSKIESPLNYQYENFDPHKQYILKAPIWV